ncbi:TIGR02594 family protein [Rhizobium rhizoryzae]|uniref:Uncharacterized protein (TIGR02594 family) n=1 Tax=Rhizobium rhizoryzae TaxID=451876 RepID=A0A7W6LMW3_9HYPH|nr:TIGR02594 family protein [Rhizobium rhizoryzae]MBB4146021.1 uncharacterized protein (TIGR02594 family) [Rhizobium rhizoryzae]
MTDAVTKLVVDASGALRTLGDVEGAFQAVGQASDRAAAELADFDARMAKINAAMAANEKLSTQRVDRISQEQRAYQNWISKSSDLGALQIRQQREIARVSVDAANAVITGITSEVQARNLVLQTLQRHRTEVDQLNAKLNGSSSAQAANVKRIDETTKAYERLHRASNDNAISTANLAAQFQDIAVTAAMGMSPLQIALQQGTQIAGAFGNAGATSAVKALGGAFLALVSPVALASVALTAATAAAIQYFMTSVDKTKATEAALEQHANAIRALKEAYGEAAAGAREYLSETKNTAQALTILAGIKLGDQLKDQFADLRKNTSLFRTDADKIREELDKASMSFGMGNQTTEQAAKINALTDQLQKASRESLVATKRFQVFGAELQKFGKDGDFLALREGIAIKLNADPANKDLAKLADEVFKLTDTGTRLQSAMRAGEESVTGLGQAAVASASNVMGFAQALGTLTNMVPALAAAERGVTGVRSANEAYAAALGALNKDMQNGVIKSEDAYFQRLKKVEEAHKQAIQAVTGYADASDMVAKAERQNAIDGMSDREAAAARIRDTYAEQEKAIRATVAAGADQAKAEELIARNSQAMDTALANSGRHFDELADKAGEKGASKSLREYERAVTSAQNTADRLVDKMFPGEGARREAQELLALLDQYGDKLTDVQRSAVMAEADNLFRAADLGLRDLDDATKKHGKSMADSLESTLGDALGSLFSSPIKDLDDFVDRVLSAFARLGEENLQKTFDGLFGGGSSSKGGKASSGGLLSGIGSLFGGGGSSNLGGGVSSASQLRDVSSALGKTTKSALDVAKQFEGLNERADSPVLNSFLMASGNWNRLSVQDTAWCAAFANASIAKAGGQGTGSNLASSFLNWGTGTNTPQPGDIVVLKPQSAGSSGHVGFLASYGNGKVQVFGGNQSNGVNVKTFDASEVAGFRTDPTIMRSAVSGGVLDASKQMTASAGARGVSPDSQSWQANTTYGDFLGANSGQGGGMGAFGGLLSAGLGGFGMGAQTQNPLMGALGGAMSGWSAGAAIAAVGGPIGAVVGGIAGLLGGIFGKSKQKKQELRQAQQELESQIGSIIDLMRTSTGAFIGAFEKEYLSVTDEYRKAMQLADKAKNYQLKSDLEKSMDVFFDKLSERWNRGFEGMLKSMESGQGLNSEFMAGMDSIEKMRESLVGFINDAKMFADANGDLAAYYKTSRTPPEPPVLNQYQEVWTGGLALAGLDVYEKNVLPEGYKNVADQMYDLGVQVWNEKGGALYKSLSELIKVAQDAGLEVDQLGTVTKKAVEANVSYSDSVDRARQAAIKSALALVTGEREFTEMEKAIQKAQGAASNLPSLLRDLGMSAQDAAKAVDGALNVALSRLRDDWVSDMTASIGDLSGVGYINDVMEALKTYEGRLTDATALGFDASLAVRELSLSIKDIVRNADLTKDEIDALGAAFPQLRFALNGVNTATQGLSDAKSDLDAAYRKEASAIDELISASKQGIAAIKQFRDAMRISDKSPLSPADKLAEAARQFRDISEKARNGDEDALNDLTQISQTYLDEAKSYYASSSEYYRIWTEVDQTLASVQAATEGQLSQAEKQKAALDAQVNGILKLDDSVGSVRDALDRYNQANIAALDAVRQQISLVGLTGANAINAAFASLNIKPTDDQTAYWRSQIANGRSADQVTEAIKGSREWELNMLYRNIMGRDLDAAGRVFFLQSGKTNDQISADLEWAKAHGAMRSGGIVGAFARGGIVGNGILDRDTVRARYASGGDILLAGGEHVTRETSVNRNTYGTLEYINRTGRVPGNDDSALVAEIRSLKAELAALQKGLAQVAAVTAASGQVVAEAVSNTTGAVNALGKQASAAGLRRG